MKKIISIITAVAASAAALFPISANAETERYTPLYYFKANETENVRMISDDVVLISPQALSDGDIMLNVGVYIEDESKSIYAASAKWRSESEHITLENIVDPSAATGIVKEYTTSDGISFSTDLTPFCYMSVKDGAASVSLVPQIIEKPEINSMYFSYASMYANVLPILGASSDEFPFTSFDAVIDSDTPEGEYEIVFATEDNTEGDSSMISHGAISLSYTNFYSFRPRTRDLKIIVGDYKLGDVNADNIIDAVDASLALAAYAKTATGKDMGMTELQKLAANVNGDGVIDAVDASLILSYYAYRAVGGNLEFPEFLADRL